MGDDYENWSPEMIEPMYDDDIQTMIQEVNPQQLQSKFVRITDEQMPEILKFIDESNEYQFDDWAIIGESKGEDEESVPGSGEDPTSRKAVPKNLFSDADGLEVEGEVPAEEEEEEVEEEEEEAYDESQEAAIAPPDNENSMVFSMFLTNWEDQVRQIQDAKRQEWQKKWQELLGPEEEEPTDEGEKSFVDDDGESWVLLDSDAPITAPALEAPKDLQVALVQPPSQVARRTGFFEKWPSFNVGSKLGVVLTATGTSFAFGFMMGARAAMDSFYRLCERPLVAGVVGVTTAFAVSIQPTLLASAVKYIILGGVIGGTAVATPVFVVGTTGVFVSAAVYHSWILAKRGVTRTFASPGSRSVASPPPLALPPPAKPIAVPLTHAPHHHCRPCCPAEDQKCST